MSTKGTKYIGGELELFSQASNWKSYWSNKVKDFIGNTVLDVGAGIGSNIELLRRTEMKWTALEPDQNQALQIRKKFGHLESVTVTCGTLQSLDKDSKYDSIIYIDVLEHIEHDASELSDACKRLNKEGRIVVLAPAHQSLFSPFDEAVGHFRRYSKSTLLTASPQSLAVEHIFYLDSVGYAASLINAKLLRSSMPTELQIKLWDKVMVPLSRIFDRILGYRFGKTVVMILKKT